jgi:cellulose synthase/poly-beta-1,6-N-acetylglucosamine synthase-like glycosyltransferase
MSPPVRQPGAVTVIVTVLRDLRVDRTLASLLHQTRPPDVILVDDGGGEGPVKEMALRWAARDPRVVYLEAPGSIPESRNIALRVITTEFVAFLDADEVAPPEWLGRLLQPFEDPTVAFTGGPTPAMEGTAITLGARYYDAYLRRFYDTVARRHPHALPMGNSAWRVEIFDRVGLLDTTLYERAASEDQEIALRALRAGYRGVYVPDAMVAHDFSDLTLYRLLAKQNRYALGGYVVWRRHRSTYEATPGGVLPYLLPPGLVALGALLLPWPVVRGVGTALLGAGGILWLAVLLALEVQGLLWERSYPGMRLRPIEFLRRWATLIGAARGMLRYGIRGYERGRKSRTP